MNILRALLCLAFAFFTSSAFAAAQNHQLGDWHGVLDTPAGKLTLLVHLEGKPGAELSGHLESIDQAPGQKIPLASIIETAQELSFSVPAIGATYRATWNDAEQSWSGDFRQGATFQLELKRGEPAAAPVVVGLDGVWRASLQREQATLRLVLHISTGKGGTRAALDSPDINVFGMAVEALVRAEDTVRFSVPLANVTFEGKFDQQLQTVSGLWLRTGQSQAIVTFKRDSAEAAVYQRSQWPVTPEGYTAREVMIPNPHASGVVIAGTLTVPDGSGPFPAAVLISGSGPQDRDETIYGHKPFAVLADYLSKQGIAVLRYDDRGFGESTGDFEAATSADFATDANAALDYLRSRPEINPAAVGMIGHSEGGMIGPIAAADNANVAFLILLGAPGTNTDQLLLSQWRMTALSQGISEGNLKNGEAVIRDVLVAVRASSDPADARRRLNSLLTTRSLQAMGMGEAQRESFVKQSSSPWMRYFINYRPAEFLARVRVPVLALGGSVDHQVPSAENLPAIRHALSADNDVTIEQLPSVNHMFQTAKTGASGEYADIDETFAPVALQLIAHWIHNRFKGS